MLDRMFSSDKGNLDTSYTMHKKARNYVSHKLLMTEKKFQINETFGAK